MITAHGFVPIRTWTGSQHKPAWQQQRGDASVMFHAVGRGRRAAYWVAWDNGRGGSGGQRVESFYAAEQLATQILARITEATS